MSTPRTALTHAPVTQFSTLHGELCVGGVPLGRLAARAAAAHRFTLTTGS